MGVIYDKMIREKDENVEYILVCDWLTLHIPKNTPKAIKSKVLERWFPTEQKEFDFEELS